MLKTTFIGGILFLIPFGILLLVLQEVLSLALLVVDPIASLFPEDDYWGISLALILAVVLIVLVCFLAGLAARYAAVSGVSSKADQFLAKLIPGYDMLRARIAGAITEDQDTSSSKVVTIQAGGLRRYALLIEEFEKTGEALVFLPGSPNAETGILGRVPMSELEFENIPVHKLHHAFKFYGRGLGNTRTEPE